MIYEIYYDFNSYLKFLKFSSINIYVDDVNGI